ncbi:protocadherin alpha-3 isoform X3 [Salmo salar]|uniref:Protocadherin alpha-3 isoform X3 n=1 Tax=Salmo salar TaxID=8030 RepID=A0ABM3F9D0_SALSA|nr:protocadherin alpha-3-like isoform X3 [Salmo salar]
MGDGEQRRRWEYWWVALRFSLLLCFVEQVSAQIRYSIPEEVKEGSVVGNVAKDLGLDVSTLVDRRFRIVSGSKDALFQINQNNGVLYVHRNIDREEHCDGTGACLMNLKIVVENPLEIHYVQLEIKDVNDHSPMFTEKEQHFEIAEHVPPGTRLQIPTARDPDIGVNSVRFYKLSQNHFFDIDIKDSDEDKIPFLILQKSLDRENRINHSLVLTAIDGGNPPKSGSLNITVTVLDVNDNKPVFSQDTYSVTLQENAPIGTVVVKVRATDLDEGLNRVVEYSLGRNLKSKVYDVFELDSVTGEITVKAQVDFDDTEVYKLSVQASDRGQPPWTVECRVIIKILDVNDNKPEIEVTSLSNMVSEDSKPETVISLISVSDKDSGINGKVLCSLLGDVPFELKPSFQDNMYSLVTKQRLDRELVSHYDITITATDCGQPPLSTFKTLSVQISDVNDNSPEFSQNPIELYLVENNGPGASIFSVTATDKDLNENAAISYHIVRGEGTQNDMTSFLNINSDNGHISALKSFDFETLKTFQFQVVATDSGIPSLSSNVTINVFILDQNDNAPVILYPVSANGSAEGVEEIPRNVNAGHLVTKVRAYDADIGYNGWLLFSLQEVTDHSLFALDRYTGQIRTLRSFTETDEAEHKLAILVKDNGNVSLSATATVIINVVEPKEAFAASDVKSAVKDEEENSVTFYLIITLGSVSALFIISIIMLIVMQCSKAPDDSSKYLQDVNYDGTLCHSIQYRPGDKRYMLVGPRMSIGSTIVPGSNGNTLVVPDHRRRASGEMRSETLRQDPRSRPQSLSHTQPRKLTPKVPNSDWRYSASLRTGMQSSVHMEESSVMQGAQGVLVQNWPTVSSATGDAEGGETSPPMGAGVDSNSWHFRYGAGGPGGPPQHLKPGEVPPEAFIIPGSPAIISIRQQGGEDDKSDFITFGKKEEAKKKKKKKKEKKDKKDKGKDDDE